MRKKIEFRETDFSNGANFKNLFSQFGVKFAKTNPKNVFSLKISDHQTFHQ